MVLGIFKVALRLRGWHDFMKQSLEILNVFNIFSKTKTFFKKLEYCFLVKSTSIENESFPYKTAMPEVNVNDISTEKQQKQLTTRIFKNKVLAASDYVIV